MAVIIRNGKRFRRNKDGDLVAAPKKKTRGPVGIVQKDGSTKEFSQGRFVKPKTKFKKRPDIGARTRGGAPPTAAPPSPSAPRDLSTTTQPRSATVLDPKTIEQQLPNASVIQPDVITSRPATQNEISTTSEGQRFPTATPSLETPDQVRERIIGNAEEDAAAAVAAGKARRDLQNSRDPGVLAAKGRAVRLGEQAQAQRTQFAEQDKRLEAIDRRVGKPRSFIRSEDLEESDKQVGGITDTGIRHKPRKPKTREELAADTDQLDRFKRFAIQHPDRNIGAAVRRSVRKLRNAGLNDQADELEEFGKTNKDAAFGRLKGLAKARAAMKSGDPAKLNEALSTVTLNKFQRRAMTDAFDRANKLRTAERQEKAAESLAGRRTATTEQGAEKIGIQKEKLTLKQRRTNANIKKDQTKIGLQTKDLDRKIKNTESLIESRTATARQKQQSKQAVTQARKNLATTVTGMVARDPVLVQQDGVDLVDSAGNNVIDYRATAQSQLDQVARQFKGGIPIPAQVVHAMRAMKAMEDQGFFKAAMQMPNFGTLWKGREFVGEPATPENAAAITKLFDLKTPEQLRAMMGRLGMTD